MGFVDLIRTNLYLMRSIKGHEANMQLLYVLQVRIEYVFVYVSTRTPHLENSICEND